MRIFKSTRHKAAFIKADFPYLTFTNLKLDRVFMCKALGVALTSGVLCVTGVLFALHIESDSICSAGM